MDEVCRMPFSGQVDHSASCYMNPELYAVLQSRVADPKTTEKQHYIDINTQELRSHSFVCWGETKEE